MTAAVGTASAAGTAPGAGADLLEPSRSALESARVALLEERDPAGRAWRLLETGAHDAARDLVPRLAASGTAGEEIAARILFAVVDFETLEPLIASFGPDPDPSGVREMVYRWRFARDDLVAVETLVEARAGALEPVDHLAAGELALALRDRERAEMHYREALAGAALPATRARAHHGLSQVAFKRRQWEASLDALTAALAESPLDPDVLTDLSRTLIRLGRTGEAIAAVELAVEVSPYHERAHYSLGNGYARKNYTELYADYADVFARGGAKQTMNLADKAYEIGALIRARMGYEALLTANPHLADLQCRLGSISFQEGDLDASRAHFRMSLELCPEYGRAHNGMAKTLEAVRIAHEVHRPDHENAFEAAPLPGIVQVSSFVVNWSGLDNRHKKRVALSLEPWKRFIPPLVAGGCTFYIKPLHELLSETPGQELLRDQRISYDSRLWDDVRGCGGYNTVTGIEDVERTVYGRYNTVLHELSHQVHGILPADRGRQINELYRETKRRDEETGDAFLSRYAGSSVWEYFAEGANALFTPRRDAYDTREITRERLEELDPALGALVREIMTEADVESTYAVALTNRGDNELSKGKPAEALASFRRSLERTPDEENALGSMIHALIVVDSTEVALEWAGRAAIAHPESGTLAVRMADALWFGGYGLDAALSMLRDAGDAVRPEDAAVLHRSIGRLSWIQGDAKGAREAYESALAEQADDPGALWGLAASHALAGEWVEAWKRYEEALERRTGVVELREAFAFDLLRAGETERARQQVNEARLLDPEAPEVLALAGWIALDDGDPETALAHTARALELGSWSDLARVVRARAQIALGRSAEAGEMLAPLVRRIERETPPEYVYLPRWGRYRRVHDLPAALRMLLPDAAR
jgi:tetratricopeptide (TPR) repeat protein